MGHVTTLVLTGAVLAFMVVLATAPAALALEPRDKAWLVNHLIQPPPDTPRNKRYLAMINQGSDNHCGVDVKWFKDTAPKSGKIYLSRPQTNALGRLAYCYHTQGTRYFKDAQTLEIIRQCFQGVVAHVSDEGKFIWESKMNEYGYDGEVHEHAWRVEPLLAGLIWAGPALPAAEQKAAEDALRRAGEWLFKHPLLQTNNRGCVWLAVMTLCGLYFEKPEWVQLADRNWKKIIYEVIAEDGESGEHTGQYAGGGPDSNYSYTGWSYVYLYRLFSGNTECDERLTKAMRWFAAYNTLSGCPNADGASVRRRYVSPDNFQDILPALERYSHGEPFFATLAEHALAKKEKCGGGFGGHLISPLIWAMLERGVEAKPGPFPDWYVDFTGVYSRPAVHYALIRRSYSTGITFRGRTEGSYNYPLRGLQCFAWDDEYPVVLQSDSENSSTRADGVDTATANVEKAGQDWEVVLTKGARLDPWRAELVTLAARRKTLWECYACTPAALVVVYGGAKGPLTTRWAMNSQFISEPRLDAAQRTVSFSDRKGRLCYLAGEASLAAGKDAKLLEVVCPAPLSVFGFSNDAFRFEKYDAQKEELSFADASGRYRLSLAGMLDAQGNLKRNGPPRLVADATVAPSAPNPSSLPVRRAGGAVQGSGR